MELGDIISVPPSLLVLAILAAGARFFVASELPNLWGIVSAVVLALFISAAIHPLLEDKEYSKGLVTLMIALGSFFARDILELGIRLMQQAKADPMAIVRELLNWRRGGGDR